MGSQVTNYQCPACTGPLHYDGAVGRLACDFCGSSFSTQEIEALYAQKDADAARAQAEAEKQRAREAKEAREAAAVDADALSGAGEEGAGWAIDSAGAASDDVAHSWGAEADDVRVYNCPSCGAELICDVNTAATACPYCDNPAIIPGQLGGALKPDCVIPFRLKKEDAKAALRKHYEGRPFLPKVFKDENHLDEIKGVYVPFWLFDGQAEGSAYYDATRVRSYRRGDYLVTETSHFDVYREGAVGFSLIPVDASKRMDNDYMDSLEPYDYRELVPFSTAYLPGYFADKYDETAEECGPRIDARATESLADLMQDTVVGYATVMERGRNVRMRHERAHYALLPVWLLNTTWNGQRFMFAMNGQTGKFVGHLPTDKALRRAMKLKVYFISLAVCLALAAGLGLFEFLGMLGG